MAIIKLRRATETEWTTSNPTLRAGEVGVQLASDPDDVIFKIGDGATPWTTLPAYSPGGSGGGGAVVDATNAVKGVLKLAGDLGGTADSPTVPGKAPLVHTHSFEDIDDIDTALPPILQPIVDNSLLGGTVGNTAGVPIKPWAPEPPIGGELWTLANMVNGGANYQTSSLTVSQAASGANQLTITKVKFADTTAGNEAFRIEFDWTAPSDGWAAVSLGLRDASGTVLKNDQMLVGSGGSGAKSGHFLWDFQPGLNGGSLLFDLRVERLSNATTGNALSISNVSIRAIASDAQRAMQVAQQYQGGVYPEVYFQQKDVKTDTWKMGMVDFWYEADLTPFSFQNVNVWDIDMPFNSHPPDPTFTRPTFNLYDNFDEPYAPTFIPTSMRINNNDQIHVVWNGTAWEYRGNTHGGEFTRPGVTPTLKIDRGVGFVPWTLSKGLQGCRRFQVYIPSEIRRTVDGTTPYCTVDRKITIFQDGMMRTDRTMTFTASTILQGVFEWMSSHKLDTPYLGRIGRGLTVLAETSSFPTVAVPAVPTSTTATTGGTLPAATYSYRVTALSAYGETTVSPAKTQVVPAGTSTNTVTVSWTAVSNATGYRVYGRINGGPEGLLASTTALSFVDTGAVPQGVLPPKVNTAWLFNATTVDTMGISSTATWAVYKDPKTGWCYGNIYDRDSALSRSGVTGIVTRLMRGAGIQKNYANLIFGGFPSLTVPPGTVWTATHWNYAYLPADPDQYHNEIAVRAAYLNALKDIYPST